MDNSSILSFIEHRYPMETISIIHLNPHIIYPILFYFSLILLFIISNDIFFKKLLLLVPLFYRIYVFQNNKRFFLIVYFIFFFFSFTSFPLLCNFLLSWNRSEFHSSTMVPRQIRLACHSIMVRSNGSSFSLFSTIDFSNPKWESSILFDIFYCFEILVQKLSDRELVSTMSSLSLLFT